MVAPQRRNFRTLNAGFVQLGELATMASIDAITSRNTSVTSNDHKIGTRDCKHSSKQENANNSSDQRLELAIRFKQGSARSNTMKKRQYIVKQEKTNPPLFSYGDHCLAS